MLACSFERYQYFDDWFTSVSMTSPRKSANMISTTGRSPRTAAPNAAPVNASSEIGVSMTRFGPKRAASAGVTLNTPPGAMSSPSKTTRSSRSISSASPS
jgi:hypothetical protein